MFGKIIAFIAVAAVAVDACSYPIVPSTGCVPSCGTIYPDVAPSVALASAVVSASTLPVSACGYPGVYPYGLDGGLYGASCGIPACGLPALSVPALGVPACGVSTLGLPALSLPGCGVPACGFSASYLPGVAAPYYNGCF